MKFFALFIYRPVATILISLAITLCGVLGFRLLPVAPLPQVDFPVIMVSASLPGASPETMASSVATPLERSLGRIAGVNEMTSSSSLGSTRIILEFSFDRDINGAARDVQAAINAAQSLLPSGMPSRPTYRKANPSDAPIMILTLTSETDSQGQLYDFASTQLAQTLSQIDGVGDVSVGGSSLPAVRVGLNPQALFNQGVSLDEVRTAISNANVRKPQGAIEDSGHRWQMFVVDLVELLRAELLFNSNSQTGNELAVFRRCHFQVLPDWLRQFSLVASRARHPLSAVTVTDSQRIRDHAQNEFLRRSTQQNENVVPTTQLWHFSDNALSQFYIVGNQPFQDVTEGLTLTCTTTAITSVKQNTSGEIAVLIECALEFRDDVLTTACADHEEQIQTQVGSGAVGSAAVCGQCVTSGQCVKKGAHYTLLLFC